MSMSLRIQNTPTPIRTTLPGLLMLAGSVMLIVVGVFWMRKLIDIEV